jgi:hypothetical protein
MGGIEKIYDQLGARDLTMNDDTGKIEEQTTDFIGMLLVFFASK